MNSGPIYRKILTRGVFIGKWSWWAKLGGQGGPGGQGAGRPRAPAGCPFGWFRTAFVVDAPDCFLKSVVKSVHPKIASLIRQFLMEKAVIGLCWAVAYQVT